MSTIHDVLKAENRKLLDALKRLEDATAGEPEERRQHLDDVRHRVLRLEELEEGLLYPLLDTDSRSRRMVAEARRRQRAVGEALERLAEVAADESEFQPRAEALHGAVRHRVEHEEDELLVAAELVLSDTQAREIAAAFVDEHPDMEPGKVAERSPGPVATVTD